MDNNNLFYERLSKEAKKRKKSMNSIERELGYPRNALSNYKNGSGPSGIRLVELAEYFQISPEYLIGKKKFIPKPDVHGLFHSLDTEEKIEIIKIVYNWIVKQGASYDCVVDDN